MRRAVRFHRRPMALKGAAEHDAVLIVEPRNLFSQLVQSHHSLKCRRRRNEVTSSIMARLNPAWETLFARLATLKANWPARAWSWDKRFTCITSSFTVEYEAQARAAARAALPTEVTSKTLTLAPADVRALAERTGGLRAGQMLLRADDAPGLLVFGLWWPWGDDATTSFRMGIDDVEWNDDPYPRFRQIFNVATE